MNTSARRTGMARLVMAPRSKVMERWTHTDSSRNQSLDVWIFGQVVIFFFNSIVVSTLWVRHGREAP